ncbi:hypothetical protein [Ligilactobacillus aviarius]|uniref:hypothetical protein n=1 Tax=Ligilactobacillus aviarius TaxID=1606 RepID=UPI003D2EFF8D
MINFAPTSNDRIVAERFGLNVLLGFFLRIRKQFLKVRVVLFINVVVDSVDRKILDFDFRELLKQ